MAGLLVVCASAQTPSFNTGQAARLVIGQKNFTIADYGATNQLIGSPAGIALANGVLWVVDSNRLGSTPNNNRVLRFSDVSTYPSPTERPDIPGSTCGACRGTASLVLGQPDFFTVNRSLNASGVRNPTGVATDGTVLVVSDTDNNRVLIWRTLPQFNGQPADVVIGQADFTHNGTSVPPTQTSLRGPEGVWISNGKLFIADTQDNRILIYNKIPTSNNAPADVVVGQKDFTAFVQPDITAKQPTTAADNLQSPISVSSDGIRLFISDLGQNRVLIWNSIPTTNGAPANVVIGQPDMNSAVENNSFTIAVGAASDSSGHPVGATGVLCSASGTDSDNNVYFPTRCGRTLSFPRFAISDGTRLFLADGGNDRVLIFNKIPTANAPSPDIILGQPDEFSDNTGDNPDGTNAFQTPTALAWDGTNLFVSDGYNRRIVIFSPAIQNIPLDGIRNAASQEIYAIGSVTVGGTITAKDTISITIQDKSYTYTVKDKDTLDSVVQGLASLINAAPDPNVVATVNLSAEQVVLTARKPGADGGNITLATATSANATVVGTTSGATLNIYLENPSQIAPGTVIEVNGKNLCDQTATADFSQVFLPRTLGNCTLYVDGVAAPLIYVSPTQINAQMMQESQDRTSVSIYSHVQHTDGSVTVSTPVATTIVPQNPGLFAQPGSDPRRGIIYHGSSSAFDLIGVDGTIQAGDTGTLTIGAATYSYTVQASDTLDSIRDTFIRMINSAPDPNVHAAIANEYHRFGLFANIPGPAGEGTAVTAAVTTTSANTGGAALLLTAYNPTLCCSNIQGALVNDDNPAVPGEMLYTFSTGIGVSDPQTVDTGQIYRGGAVNPPKVLVDSILTGGTTANPVSVSFLPGTVGVYYVQFLISSGLASNAATQMTIAQQAFVSNVVTFPVANPGLASELIIVPNSSSVASGSALGFTVTAVDYKGNIATSYTGTVHITSGTDGAATLPADFSLNAGTGTFQVTFNTKGYNSVTATDIGTPSITGTSPSINVQ
jgi:uncharacterized protein (TIGR03437 family)